MGDRNSGGVRRRPHTASIRYTALGCYCGQRTPSPTGYTAIT